MNDNNNNNNDNVQIINSWEQITNIIPAVGDTYQLLVLWKLLVKENEE